MAEHEAIYELAAELVNELIAAGRTVATAESCTGGWIAKALTDVSGSSQCFGYGIVSYSNDAKESLLGVQPGTLESAGAVSEEVVAEMVDGVLALSGADIGVAVSGVAGPDGGSDAKPVGTVCFAWAVPGRAPVTERRHFDGDRDAVRVRTVIHALERLREELKRVV
jgi:nicotinamide-nucleotide amidase